MGPWVWLRAQSPVQSANGAGAVLGGLWSQDVEQLLEDPNDRLLPTGWQTGEETIPV